MTKVRKRRRGSGRWHRAILAALNQHPAFFARDLLGSAPTRAQQVALNRAVRELHDRSKIQVARWWGRNPAGGRIVVYRAETFAPPPSMIARLECNGDERASMQQLSDLHSHGAGTIFEEAICKNFRS